MNDVKIVTKKLEADTLIRIVIDMSGSMNRCREQTIHGFNEYMDSYRNKTEAEIGKVLVTVLTFNSIGWGTAGADTTTMICENVPLAEVPRLSMDNFIPNGGTPLYDTLQPDIHKAREDQQICGKNTNVLYNIFTDGEDTTSQLHGKEDVAALLKYSSDWLWTVTYFGADQDAWSVSAGLGIAAGNTMNYSVDSIEEGAFTKAADATAFYMSNSTMMKSRGIAEGYTTSNLFDDSGVEQV